MADGNGKVVNSDIYEPLLSVAWRGADALIQCEVIVLWFNECYTIPTNKEQL